MGSRYKIRDQSGHYFVTFTVTGWVDLFIRNDYRDCIINSFKYCVKNKGLKVHAYVLMTSHIHAILSAEEGEDLAGIIRDLKKFTSKRLVDLIKTIPESRREWLLNKFRFEANRTSRGKYYQVWEEGYHGIQIESNEFLDQKLDYIHENPVKAGFVSSPEDYLYSSARNYCEEQGVMEVDLLD